MMVEAIKGGEATGLATFWRKNDELDVFDLSAAHLPCVHECTGASHVTPLKQDPPSFPWKNVRNILLLFCCAFYVSLVLMKSATIVRKRGAAQNVADVGEVEARRTRADQISENEKLIQIVYAALLRRHPKSRTRGRLGTPAEIVLCMLQWKELCVGQSIRLPCPKPAILELASPTKSRAVLRFTGSPIRQAVRP
jgi:hypothetical protein